MTAVWLPRESNVQGTHSHSRDCDNAHGTVESKYKYRFFVNVSCGVTGKQFTGPHIFLQSLADGIYANC